MWLEVTLKSSAGEIQLSTVGGAAGVFLLDGVRGFGLPEREIESTPLPGVHGSVFRSTRFGESEMMLPVAFRDENQSRVALRVREFERVLAPASSEPVELIVRAPELGTVRRRWCYYVDGLQGGLGGQDSHVWWRHCAVKLLALDPLWFGQTRVHEQRVAAARKAFITGAAPRVQRRNIFPNPNMIGLYGVMYNSSRAQLGNVSDGDESAIRVTRYQPPVTFPDSSPDIDFNAPAGVFLTMSFDVRSDTVDEITVMAGNNPTVQEIGPDWRRVTLSGLSSPSSLAHRFGAYFRPEAAIGDWFDIRRVLVEETDELGEFFSGDTPDTSDMEYRWEGTPNQSVSVEDARGAAHAVPFFPVMLSDSTVQGAHVLTIQGDAEAWPVWEVTGPGEDLLIQNDETGDRIFVEGQIGETITITTRPQVQDVVSASAMDGSLWERVSEDSTFFPLQPGINKVRMSMVNGKPESTVTLRYVEQWMAGF